MTRLYVGGFQYDICQKDLEPLLSKVGCVEEIYIPEKKIGWNGGFAIAKISEASDNEKLLKTIKALNGSIWRGSKIKIEVAKEWYHEKIVREKSEIEEQRSSQPLAIAYSPPQKFSLNYLTIRKARGCSKKRVSTDPYVSLDEKLYCPKAIERNLVCNKKIIFDTDMADLKNYEEFKGKNNIFPTKSTPIDKAASIKSKSTNIGTGIRRGFGALLKEKSIDCCIEDPADNEVINEDGDGVPSVPLEELLPENLEKERQRALSVLFSLSEPKRRKIEVAKDKSNTINEEKPDIVADSEKVVANAKVAEATISTDHPKTVNTTKLKDIFAKEGGVWWDNVDNVKSVDAINIRGNLSNDVIFKEAEQFGFDIRDNSKQQTNLFSFNFAEQLVPVKENIKKLSVEPSSCAANHLAAENKDHFHFNLVFSLAKRFHRDRTMQDTLRAWESTKQNRLYDIRKKYRDAKRLSKAKTTNRKKIPANGKK